MLSAGIVTQLTWTEYKQIKHLATIALSAYTLDNDGKDWLLYDVAIS